MRSEAVALLGVCGVWWAEAGALSFAGAEGRLCTGGDWGMDDGALSGSRAVVVKGCPAPRRNWPGDALFDPPAGADRRV